MEKPLLEIYTFIDPICPECWAFEPTLRKLQVEYGEYFRIRYVIAGKLNAWDLCNPKYKDPSSLQNIAKVWEKTASRTGMSCDGDLWFEDPISSPYTSYVAIKAAEMQGRQAGGRFLRKLRERLFLNKQNVSKEEVLLECAAEAGLDVEEFKNDLHSNGSKKALQCDVKTTKEMNVDHVPTFVFFNERIEDEGIKVAGIYQYEVYVQIIQTLLGYKPDPAPPNTLEQFLSQYNFVATKEVAVVFNISVTEAENRLKRLMLQQKVERVPVKYGTFWRHLS
nr:ClpXP adapter SpxH family protein [Bacillus sp. FJAT-45350]